eukprot:5846564-Prorocentrum_lima.AAC.1
MVEVRATSLAPFFPALPRPPSVAKSSLGKAMKSFQARAFCSLGPASRIMESTFCSTSCSA